jgi:hypothetical protein
MTWLNSNTLHNLISLILLVVGALGTFDWTSLGATPETAVHIVSALALVTSVLKLLVNVSRDGVTGLVKPQPPVKQ